MARLEVECTERSGILAKFSRKRSRDSDMPTFVRANCHERRENRMRQSGVRRAEPLRKHGRQQLADGAIERSDTREMDPWVTAFQAHEETLHAGTQTEPLPIDCACSAGEEPIVACLIRRYRAERGQRVSELRRRQPARNAPERLLSGLLACAQQAHQAGDRVGMTWGHSAYQSYGAAPTAGPPNRSRLVELATDDSLAGAGGNVYEGTRVAIMARPTGTHVRVRLAVIPAGASDAEAGLGRAA